ncbi:hypothetical protein ACA910_002799 [Epithemia clementina (nom. ined.)]
MAPSPYRSEEFQKAKVTLDKKPNFVKLFFSYSMIKKDEEGDAVITTTTINQEADKPLFFKIPVSSLVDRSEQSTGDASFDKLKFFVRKTMLNKTSFPCVDFNEMHFVRQLLLTSESEEEEEEVMYFSYVDREKDHVSISCSDSFQAALQDCENRNNIKILVHFRAIVVEDDVSM